MGKDTHTHIHSSEIRRGKGSKTEDGKSKDTNQEVERRCISAGEDEDE